MVLFEMYIKMRFGWNVGIRSRSCGVVLFDWLTTYLYLYINTLIFLSIIFPIRNVNKIQLNIHFYYIQFSYLIKRRKALIWVLLISFIIHIRHIVLLFTLIHFIWTLDKRACVSTQEKAIHIKMWDLNGVAGWFNIKRWVEKK